MSTNQKDKRTKEQILKLLDNAIEQEELLSGKIKSLETELADCRKKAEDPRAELTEEALSSSKVSFRLDYYRTAKHGPLKGIIEHLPSRETKAFEGEGQETMGQFVARFLSEETSNTKKKKAKEVKKDEPDLSVMMQIEDLQSASKVVAAHAGESREGPGREEFMKKFEEAKQRTEPVIHTSTASFEVEAEMEIDAAREVEIKVAKATEGNIMEQERPDSNPEQEQQTSRLLQRLKAKTANEINITDESSITQAEPAAAELPVRSERVRRLLEKITPQEANIRHARTAEAVEPATINRPSLLDRLREEYHNNRLPN